MKIELIVDGSPTAECNSEAEFLAFQAAVFVALHHAVGADTPVMIVNKGVEKTHLTAALIEGGEITKISL
ncbi:hypothetical protein [Klebsiella oxytoca]|uniref:hypothetical protein n=1 Tax=Klebsiella oxytoca TaxID=571 RepID=UPI000E1B92A7|nr:hypothetical protein [Klebsiella oxytoca]